MSNNKDHLVGQLTSGYGGDTFEDGYGGGDGGGVGDDGGDDGDV